MANRTDIVKESSPQSQQNHTSAGDAARPIAADSVTVEGFDRARLSPEEQRRAQEIGAGASALLLKGLLHRHDPREFPVPPDPSSPEAIAAALVHGIDEPQFERMRPRIERLLADPPRVARALGALGDIDLRKPDLNLGRLLKPSTGARQIAPARAAKPPKYRRLDLLLRSLYCADETNPEGGSDSMVLGSLLIDANAHVFEGRSVVCGDFDDDGVRTHTYGHLPLGMYNLRATPSYPKTFYCIFQLVESDSDDAEVAHALSKGLRTIAMVFASYYGGPVGGALVSGIMDFVDLMVPVFCDEDVFPPYAVMLTLNSEGQFGGADSKDLVTSPIRGHGGAYQVWFKWHLA
ncbi:hypothetical protein [Sorangium sp. So ce131]|uniref:hypothetical protein n=1 Tax=Sorangium sp. So ce131 TaxID=3133282 RepID=UPI003F61D5C6